MYSFLQLLFNTEKISLNWRYDSTLTDYVLLMLIVIPLWQITSLVKYMPIRHKIRKKNHAAWLSIVFHFDINFSFWLMILKSNTKWCIKMVRKLKWWENQIKVYLCFRINELCRMDNFIGQSQNKNSWLIILISILDKEV